MAFVDGAARRYAFLVEEGGPPRRIDLAKTPGDASGAHFAHARGTPPSPWEWTPDDLRLASAVFQWAPQGRHLYFVARVELHRRVAGLTRTGVVLPDDTVRLISDTWGVAGLATGTTFAGPWFVSTADGSEVIDESAHGVFVHSVPPPRARARAARSPEPPRRRASRLAPCRAVSRPRRPFAVAASWRDGRPEGVWPFPAPRRRRTMELIVPSLWVVASGSFVVLAAMLFIRSHRERALSGLGWGLCGSTVVGVLGIVAAVTWAPESNQGPLWGFFLAPAGFLVGAPIGYLRRRRSESRVSARRGERYGGRASASSVLARRRT